MSRRSTFDPSGKGHWILEQLARGPVLRLDLLELADAAAIAKITYVIAALQTDGLIRHRRLSYEITSLGEVALETLRSGNAYAAAISSWRAA